MPTQERLRELYYYKDGALYARSTSQFKKKDNPLGGLNGRYLYACVDRKLAPLHRFIWIWHNGYIPDGMYIDHINRNSFDNRIENLRVATHLENCRNRTANKTSASGVVGVTRHSRKPGKWRATIAIGTYDTIEEATAARKHAEVLLGFHTVTTKRD